MNLFFDQPFRVEIHSRAKNLDGSTSNQAVERTNVNNGVIGFFSKTPLKFEIFFRKSEQNNNNNIIISSFIFILVKVVIV